MTQFHPPPQSDTQRTDDLLDRCWGKAAGGRDGADYHPVLAHMVDVAAVALVWLETTDDARTRILCSPTLTDMLTPKQVAFLVAVHDLGKVSPGFQAKVPALANQLRERELDFPRLAEEQHGIAGKKHLARLLAGQGVALEAAHGIAAATCAHHGAFPANDLVNAGRGTWEILRVRAFERLAETLEIEPLPTMGPLLDGFRTAFAGFVSVCDWLGSNTEYFPYQPGVSVGVDYLHQARPRAELALNGVGLRSWSYVLGASSFQSLFPRLTPTHLQRAAFQLAADAVGPTLILVEAPTGVGKTEAALAAADQLISAQRLSGMFYGLPTQATSNQMLGRVREFLDHRYPAQRTNLHLAHGLAHLNQVQQDMRFAAIYGDGSASGTVADDWFRSRKRTLIAPFAVGTVDQAMLAALQVKHFFVRMFGLSAKVIVIDEVHAYDAFMSTILDRLLEWARALGSSVVLLSATLPRGRRDALLAAWGSAPSASAPYPRIGVASQAGAAWHPLPPGQDRQLRWTRVDPNPEAVAQWLVGQMPAGGCAAWVCNTVRGAQAAYLAMLNAGWSSSELTLFHARFTVDDRQRLENAVLSRFSRDGDRPARHAVIATQVIEQSLDLDFDIMVSDIAPIDLLLQRAGRLHRHQRPRPENLLTPILAVACPDAQEDTPDFGPAKYVYDEHVLLRTWLALHRQAELRIPSQSDALLSAVYDDAEPPTDTGDARRATWIRTAEEQRITLNEAKVRPLFSMIGAPGHIGGATLGPTTLVDPDDSSARGRALTARTRDIEETATLIALYVDDLGAWHLDADGPILRTDIKPDAELERQLLGRTVSIQNAAWVRRLRPLSVPTAWAECAALARAHPIAFARDGVATVDGASMRLHPHLGLCLDIEPVEEN